MGNRSLYTVTGGVLTLTGVTSWHVSSGGFASGGGWSQLAIFLWLAGCLGVEPKFGLALAEGLCDTWRGESLRLKASMSQLVKKFPSFYGTRSSSGVFMFLRARNWPLSWGSWLQPTSSHPVPLRRILILSSNLCLDLPNVLFASYLPSKILYTFLISLIHVTCPICIFFMMNTYCESPHYVLFHLPVLILS